MAFSKWGQSENAIQDFTQVLSLDPDHINAAYARFYHLYD